MKNQANHTNQNNQGLSRPSGSSGNLKPLYNTTIPNDWEEVKIKDIGKITSGTTPLRSKLSYHRNGTIPWVKTTDLNNSLIIETEEKITELALKETSLRIYPKDTVLVAMYGGFNQIGRSGILGIDATINQALSAITVDKKEIDPIFLLNWLNAKVDVWKNLAGSSRKDPNITSKDVGDFPFIKMPLPEQRAIADLLSTWDEAIAKHNQLIARKEQRKKWLMQNLLTGKKRLKGFEKVKWSFVRFNEIYSQVKEKAGNRKYIVLSVTKDGIVSQSEYFKKEIASEDTSPYLIMKKGDMVMSGLNFWMGSIDVLTQFDSGIVSPAYRVFEITNNSIDPDFMKFFVRSQIMLEALIGSSVIGASIVRRNLDRETLDEWAFHLPSVDEQTAIAAVLHTADKEIQLLKAKTEKLREQKKGLMQLLLTGKKRLKNF